jgi:hypothetical protein
VRFLSRLLSQFQTILGKFRLQPHLKPRVSSSSRRLGFVVLGPEQLEDRLVLNGVPTSPSIVSVQPNDYRLIVQDRLPDGTLGAANPLVAHGVNWSPASIGTTQANITAEFAKWYKTDIPLMAQMGVNVVHVYHDFGTDQQAFDILDEFYRYGIKLIMTVDSPTGSASAVSANIPIVVNAYKNHPAILMWAIGNEWNLNLGSGYYYGNFPTLNQAAAFVEQSALTIKSLDSQHPVTSVLIDDPAHVADLVNNQVPDVGIWTVNVYRGLSFGTFFQDWRSVSTKPVLIGEFGGDSFDHRINAENQAMQAQMDAGLWDELSLSLSANRVGGVAAGGLAFEWNDEWWKNGSPSTHDISSEINFGQPDGINDEEWFGILDINRNPKAAFTVLKDRFLAAQAGVALDSNPTLQAVSKGYTDQLDQGRAEFHIDGKTVYQALGGAGGGRGINVAVLDAHSGIRMQETRNFDTWLSTGGFGGPHDHFQDLITYLNSLSPGSIILLSIGDEGGFINPNTGAAWQDSNVEQGYEALEALGSTQIRQVGYNGGWAMISIKGQGKLAEAHSDPSQPVTVQTQATLMVDPNFGRRPGVTLDQFPSGAILTEGGSAISSTAALATAPTAIVTITLTPNNRDTVAPTTLTFTPSNWSTPQTVTITAVDDHVVEGPLPAPIQLASASSDSSYNGIILPSISAIVQDSPVTQLVISNLSSTSITAGGSVTFTVAAEDNNNNPVPGYVGTVKLTSTDKNALYSGTALPATYTFVAGDNGSHSFTIALQTAGSKTITATDQANSSLTATTSPIAVAAGPFSKFALSVQGGNTVVAGTSFLLTAQATDAFGNPVSGANVPTTITASASPADAQGNFPISAPVNSSGFAFLLSTLQTAGSYTITAGGGSANVIVTPAAANYFTVTAPATATTGTRFNITVKAFDRFGNPATGYTGTLNVTSTDPAAFDLLPTPYTFVAGDNGLHTFSVMVNSSTLGHPGTTIIVRDTAATSPPINGLSTPITVQGLVVPTSGFKSTATGFTVTFSKPFLPADLTLYGLNTTTVPDVTMVGANPLNGKIPGTLFIDPANPNTIVFKATNAFLEALDLNNGNAGNGDKDSVALPDDTYTVTLVSGSGTNGFVDALGSHLDGLANGTSANYTTTFTTTFQDDAHANANPAPVLAIPDFARGPDGSAIITVPNNKTVPGIPITLYNAAGVQDATFTLTYNPLILTPSAGGIGDSPAGSTFTMGTITSIDSTHSTAGFTYHNATAHSGTVVLGDILATVPNSAAAIYKTKELLTLSGITVTGGATVQAANGIHVDAYLGDVHVTALPAIDASDALDAERVASGAASGFSAYTLLDPAIIGNVGQNISVDAAAVTNLFSKAVHLAVPRIPTIPAAVTSVGVSGADPTLSLVGAAQANGIVSVAVMLDHPHPAGSTGMTEAHLAMTYDPSVLSVSAADITLGSIPGAGWRITSEVDAATGQIGINLFNLEGTPITSTQAGTLVNIDFHVVPGAAVAATSVQLVSQATPNGQRIVTEVDDDQGPLTLSTGVDRVEVAVGRRSRARMR